MQITEFRRLVKEYGFTLGRKKYSSIIGHYHSLLWDGKSIVKWQDIIIIIYGEYDCRLKLDLFAKWVQGKEKECPTLPYLAGRP